MLLQGLLADPAVAGSLIAGVALLALSAVFGLRPQLVVARPAVLLGCIAVVSLAATLALVRFDPPGLRLALDPSTEPLLPRGDPERAVYERAIREFGNDEVFVIALATDGDVFERENLLLLQRVHREIARLPGVRKVQSLADTVSFKYVPEEEWIDVGRLMDEVPESAEGLAALRTRAMSDPLLRHNLVSDDGHTAGISVRFQEMNDSAFIASRLDERIGAILADATRPGARFHVAGRPHAKASVYRGMVRDLTALVPLAVLAIAVVLALATGTRRGVVLPLANVLIAVQWTFALMALLGRPLTILSSMLGPELIAVGAVFGIHMVAGFDEEREGPGDAREIAARTLEHEYLPMLIAAATTEIGFASLCMSNVPAVVEFGAFAVFGVGCVALLALTALPAALALLPPRREHSALPAPIARWSRRFVARLTDVLARISAASARHANACILAGLIAAGVSAWAIPRIVIDTDYLSFFAEGSPVRRDFDAVNQRLAGAIPIFVVLDGSGPGSFRDPVALHALEHLQAGIDAIPGVSRTASIIDVLRVMNRAVENDDPAAEHVPDDRGTVTELLQLAPKDETARFTNVNQSRANLIVRTGAVGSAAVRALVDRLSAALQELLPEGFRGAPTGNAILLARSDDSIAGAQLQSITSAATVIFVFVALALRSLKLGVIAMIPNLLPVGMYFGMLGLGVASLSLPTSLIGAVALGIAIDDTVHFLVRYRRERAAGMSPAEAARVTGLRVGVPIATAAIMLSVGFAVIALSSFATLREFGVLFAVTVGFCLAAELVLMPALLVKTKA